jgi:hypothetical protein
MPTPPSVLPTLYMIFRPPEFGNFAAAEKILKNVAQSAFLDDEKGD